MIHYLSNWIKEFTPSPTLNLTLLREKNPCLYKFQIGKNNWNREKKKVFLKTTLYDLWRNLLWQIWSLKRPSRSSVDRMSRIILYGLRLYALDLSWCCWLSLSRYLQATEDVPRQRLELGFQILAYFVKSFKFQEWMLTELTLSMQWLTELIHLRLDLMILNCPQNVQTISREPFDLVDTDLVELFLVTDWGMDRVELFFVTDWEMDRVEPSLGLEYMINVFTICRNFLL